MALKNVYFQTVTCYGLLSTDTILNPQQIKKQITVPFYPGYRYAAVPGSGINDVVQVDIHPARPASLVYHDHCFHLMDLKVNLFSSYNSIHFLYFIIAYRFPKMSSLTKIGRADMSSLIVFSQNQTLLTR